MATVADAMRWAVTTLAAAEASVASVDASVDAAWLLSHVMGKNQAWLRAFGDSALQSDQWDVFQHLIARRVAGEPVAYLTGRQGFWSLELEVTTDTLVPRPETELLVETALALPGNDAWHVVDLGTGTGAIALALASERPNWNISATDIHPESLQLAQRNATNLRLSVEFVQSHWLRQLPGRRFHLIVSNPPYIPMDDPHLQGRGVRFEPRRALVAGADGLNDIREIIATAPEHLFDGGWLLLEHGYDQGAAVRALFATREWQDVQTRQDLLGNDRVTLARRGAA